MQKKLLLIILPICALLLFTACHSHADLIMHEDSQNVYYELRLNLHVNEEKLLDGHAKSAGTVKPRYNPFPQNIMPDARWKEGEAWTVTEYLRVLMSTRDSGGFEFSKIEYQTNFTVMVFRKTVPKAQTAASENEETQTPAAAPAPRLVSSNPFIFTYEYTLPNPFNEFRRLYDEQPANSVFDVFNNGYRVSTIFTHDPRNPASLTLPEIAQRAVDGGWAIDLEDALKDPVINAQGVISFSYIRQDLPSFLQAFPIPEGMFNPNSLNVNFVWATHSRFRVVEPDERLSERSGQGHYQYSFPALFDAQDDFVTVRFIRPNAAGWYITAILLGAATVLLVLLISKYRKPKRKFIPPTIIIADPFFGTKSLNPFGSEYDQPSNTSNTSDTTNTPDNPSNPFDGY
ncbi:MAG: hypothetical protein FWH03_03845 [Firmicutes bacterium]|nr:hypothetical protein [Bacillota bacterium]